MSRKNEGMFLKIFNLYFEISIAIVSHRIQIAIYVYKKWSLPLSFSLFLFPSLTPGRLAVSNLYFSANFCPSSPLTLLSSLFRSASPVMHAMYITPE